MRKGKYLLCGRLLPCAFLLLAVLGAGIALAVYLPRLLAPLAALERTAAAVAAMFLAASSLPAQSKFRRMLILMVPWLGVLLLFCKNPPVRKEPLFPSPFSDGVMNTLSSLSHAGCGLGGCSAESAEYFRSGREYFERLLTDLESAREEILLDFYLISRGVFFDGVLSVLERKAKAGVVVKLTYDDLGCAGSLPKNFPSLMRRRGIHVSVFHPVKPFPLSKLNRRDHRKIVVIDRKIAYTGGINLSDEYIGQVIRFGNWKDTGIRLTGEPAERFAALCEGKSERKTCGTGIPCVVFGDGARRDRTGEEIFFRLVTSAHERLFLGTPYLAPGEKLLSALKSCSKSADVRILIPHIPDKKSVFALTRSYARELISAGAQVREYAPGFYHSKNLTSDGEYVLIGSYNLDERSLSLQAECGAVLRDRTLCKAVDGDFLSSWECALPVPKATAKEAVIAFFLKLLLPLF